MKKVRFVNLEFKDKLFKKKILNSFKRILNHGQFILGPEVYEMEKKIARFCGRKFCIGTASGTDALYLAVRALDIGMKIKTINLTGDSFSIDVFEDYTKAQSQIKKDRYLKFYR